MLLIRSSKWDLFFASILWGWQVAPVYLFGTDVNIGACNNSNRVLGSTMLYLQEGTPKIVLANI